jgi:hypothetical protein
MSSPPSRALIRLAIEEDRFPHAPRLDPLRSPLVKLETPGPKRAAGRKAATPVKKAFGPPTSLANMR